MYLLQLRQFKCTAGNVKSYLTGHLFDIKLLGTFLMFSVGDVF